MYYYKKKMPVQAIKIPENLTEESPWFQTTAPQWFTNALINHTIEITKAGVNVKTLEGNMLCRFGNYLIRGIKGELYPCRADIFEECYEEYENVCD